MFGHVYLESWQLVISAEMTPNKIIQICISPLEIPTRRTRHGDSSGDWQSRNPVVRLEFLIMVTGYV
jgi:hypothetical protein